jgi:aryl-alcohol dehydrogenase (NADP+)
MRQRKMGRTGLKVSEACLGTMTFAGQADEAASRAILDAAAERGVTFLDTADVYPIPPDTATAGRTEEVLGRWLDGRRDRFVVATKCRLRVGPGPNDQGLSRAHVLAACEASLRRLKTDYIDLYFAHSPDPETPLDETLRAFDDLVRAGKVRYTGCSNYPAWQTALAQGLSERAGLARYDCAQVRYNLLFREAEAEVLPYCRDQGVGLVAYNPLAGGFLTGKYQREEPPPPGTRFSALGASVALYRDRYWQAAQFDAVTRLKEAVAPHGLSLATASVAWVLAQPGVTSAIVGASRPEQLAETLAAVDTPLDAETREALDAVWWDIPRRPAER